MAGDSTGDEMGVQPCAVHDCQRSSFPCRATFGMGCFWGAEAELRNALGPRVAICVGYMGGTERRPSHRDVSFGRTKHLEVVHVAYSPEEVAFEDLLAAFFAGHDARAKKAKRQYSSAVFFHDEYQRDAALSAVASSFPPVRTLVLPATQFWPAEPKHQQYTRRASGSSGQGVGLEPELLCPDCWLSPHTQLVHACPEPRGGGTPSEAPVVVVDPFSEGFGLVGIPVRGEDGAVSVELGGRYGAVKVEEAELQKVSMTSPEKGQVCVIDPRRTVPPAGCTGGVVCVYADKVRWELQVEDGDQGAVEAPKEGVRALLTSAVCQSQPRPMPRLRYLLLAAIAADRRFHPPSEEDSMASASTPPPTPSTPPPPPFGHSRLVNVPSRRATEAHYAQRKRPPAGNRSVPPTHGTGERVRVSSAGTRTEAHYARRTTAWAKRIMPGERPSGGRSSPPRRSEAQSE